MKTKWNLKLLYASPKDPQIEKDVKAIERAYVAFEKKYRGKDFTKNETVLLKALKDYEKLKEKYGIGKPAIYYWLRKELDGTDANAEAQIRKIEYRFTKAGNRITFFHLRLGKIEKTLQKKYLRSPALKKYRYYLERIFLTSEHDLSEPEEKILSLKASTSYDMWVSGVDKAVNKKMVWFKGKSISVNEAMNLIPTIKGKKMRRKLWSEIMQQFIEISDFAESEINAVCTSKKVNDELRGFRDPFDATIISYENDRKSVLDLVDTVTAGYRISHRFFKLKTELLKEKKITYADRSISIGRVTKKYPFTNSVETLREAFSIADEKYSDILDNFLKEGRIDVYPKQNRSGGAYCLPGRGEVPTFVLLNDVGDLRSCVTFAHEMGHAIHSERSREEQDVLYEGYSTAVAETASTFFEGLVFSHLYEKMTRKEKIIALHDRIQDDIATIFRQIAFFNFELELHTALRKDGWVPKERIAQLLNKHTAAYLGPSVKMKEEDGYFFVTVGHFRRFFYVYSYAYGQLISKALLSRYQNDPTYIKKIDQFLSAGGSKTPEHIFKDVGINVNKKLFEEGLKSIEEDIKELERLAK